MQTIAVKSITFFPSKAAADALAAKGDMTEDEGFYVTEARGRPGKFVIEVRDEDGSLLGYV